MWILCQYKIQMKYKVLFVFFLSWTKFEIFVCCTFEEVLRKIVHAVLSQFKVPSKYTPSNLCLLLQKEQNVKWGEGPSGKQAVGINNWTR